MSPENKNILEDFVQKSTIHGIGYIFDKNEKILVRLLWFIIFILSNIGFGFYAYNIYMKWTFEPDILVREKSKLLTDIPFPAVTICSPLFAKNQLANLAQFELKFREKKYNVYPNLSQSEINYMTSNIQTCDLNYLLKLERFYRRRDNNDILKLLDESFRSIDEVLFGCRRNGAKDRCKKVFIRMITHRGFCYTFNIQGHSVIFNNEDLSSAFDYPNVTAAIDVYPKSLNINELNFTKWSLDKEFLDYKFNNIRFLYPLRAKVERNAYQNIYMFINASDTNNLCWSFAKSFSFYIHLPNEILSPLHKEYSVQLGTGKLLTLSAQSFRSDESLRSYSPEIRDCYFEGERKLQFFKAYTKLNCEYECMVNYTLNQCKCVMFYMPRKSASKVCDYENYSCFIKSLADWHKETSKNKTCNCLNTCNNIEYKVAYERTSNLDNSDPEIYFKKAVDGSEFSALSFQFESYLIVEAEKFVSYKIQNLFADAGGLLGLFLGCSLISIVELFIQVCQIFAKICTRNKNGNENHENNPEIIVRRIDNRMNRIAVNRNYAINNRTLKNHHEFRHY